MCVRETKIPIQIGSFYCIDICISNFFFCRRSYRKGCCTRATVINKEPTLIQMRELYSFLITQTQIQQKHFFEKQRNRNDWVHLWLTFVQTLFCFEKSFNANTFSQITTFLLKLTTVFSAGITNNEALNRQSLNDNDLREMASTSALSSSLDTEISASNFCSLLKTSNDAKLLECVDKFLVPAMDLFFEHYQSYQNNNDITNGLFLISYFFPYSFNLTL